MVNRIEPIQSVRVDYVATDRKTGRKCELYHWQATSDSFVRDLKEDWNIQTIVTAVKYAPVGEVVYGPGVADLNTRISILKVQLEEMRSDRDTWKALANG